MDETPTIPDRNAHYYEVVYGNAELHGDQGHDAGLPRPAPNGVTRSIKPADYQGSVVGVAGMTNFALFKEKAVKSPSASLFERKPTSSISSIESSRRSKLAQRTPDLKEPIQQTSRSKLRNITSLVTNDLSEYMTDALTYYMAKIDFGTYMIH